MTKEYLQTYIELALVYYLACFLHLQYNYQGLRTKKTIHNSMVTYYFYKGTRLLAETTGTKTTWYYYDESGVCGMNYDGIDFLFEKNILGDVVAIYRANTGTLIGNYQYDAWGNILNATEVYNNSALAGNPFRYRGYYCDDETGFYYLQSRYYDPAVGRFISPDNPEMLYETAATVGGANLYAYCLNNPIMYIDPSGYGPFADFFTGLWNGFSGAIVGAWNAITNPVATFNAIINDPLGAIWGVAHFSLQMMNNIK